MREFPRALSRPLWWLALAALLLNDHVLKGAGLLPPLLSGKLSDFAGLLVAPPVLAWLLGSVGLSATRQRSVGLSATRQRSLVACTAVAVLFMAINLSQGAADAVAGLLSVVSPGARLWADPHDLVALCVMPIAYRGCAPAPAAIGSGLVQRLAIAAGAFACVATAGFGDDDDDDRGRSDAPQVVNDTEQPLSLVISSTEGAGGCELYESRRVAILTSDAFAERREVALDEGDHARLVADTDTTPCGAAWLQLPDGEQEFIYWHDLEKLANYVSSDDDRRRDRQVRIEGVEGRFRIVLGDDLERFDPGSDTEESTCDDVQARYSLSFTAPPLRQGFLELEQLTRDAQDCLLAHWRTPEGGLPAADAGADAPQTQQLCLPPWAFPFDPGDLLSMVTHALEGGGERIRFTRFEDDEIDIQLEIWHAASDFDGSLVEEVEAEECFGELSDCGAYVRPLLISIRGEEDPLSAGDQATVTAGDPEQTRILVGGARDVAWTSSACVDGEARTGASASLLELRTY